jgi:hypothetical protein
VTSAASVTRDDSKLGQLLRLKDIPFKQTEKEFAKPRRLCNTSNLDDVIRDRADVIRAYLAAVWDRYAMPTEKVRYIDSNVCSWYSRPRMRFVICITI